MCPKEVQLSIKNNRISSRKYTKSAEVIPGKGSGVYGGSSNSVGGDKSDQEKTQKMSKHHRSLSQQ